MTAHPFDFAQREHEHRSRDWTGYCLIFVRSAFGVNARYGSAAAAWKAADHQHPETDPEKIPRGVPIFWTGGRNGFGHIALSRGGGSCWTTDLIRNGQVDVARIDDVRRRWGLTLVGWTEDVNGVRVWSPPTPPKPDPLPAPPKNVTGPRGAAVDSALDFIDRALKANPAKTKPGRHRLLTAARSSLLKIRPTGKRKP